MAGCVPPEEAPGFAPVLSWLPCGPTADWKRWCHPHVLYSSPVKPSCPPRSVPGAVGQPLTESPCRSCSARSPSPLLSWSQAGVSSSSPAPGARMGSELNLVVEMSKLEVAGRGLVTPLRGTARSHLCAQVSISGCRCSFCRGLRRG